MTAVVPEKEGKEGGETAKPDLMGLPEELRTRISELDGGADALVAIGKRDLTTALSAIRNANRTRIKELCTELGEDKKDELWHDDTSQAVLAVCLELRERFPYGLLVVKSPDNSTSE